jgi:tetratricopeptide (TPR) repeat protein
VKLLRAAAVTAGLVALLLPEFPRYTAERRVGWATAAFRSLLDRADDPETANDLVAVGQSALAVAKSLQGDPRPWILGGSAYLMTRQPERALENYREAFAKGERAEIDLNLGRAYVLSRRRESAEAAFLRAGWISPEILAGLAESVRKPLLAEIARLSEELRAGRLAAPPSPPLARDLRP